MEMIYMDWVTLPLMLICATIAFANVFSSEGTRGKAIFWGLLSLVNLVSYMVYKSFS